MVRLALALAVAGSLMSAGCAAAPSAVAPEGDGLRTVAWSGVWVARLPGYGFVATDQDAYGPFVPGVAVDQEGHVLRFGARYRYGQQGEAWRVETDAGSVPERAALESVLAPGILFPDQGPLQFRVEGARIEALAASDWAGVEAALREGIRTARDPRMHEGGFVADGGSTLLHAGGQRAALDDNHDGGGGWSGIDQQMALLQAWMDRTA